MVSPQPVVSPTANGGHQASELTDGNAPTTNLAPGSVVEIRD